MIELKNIIKRYNQRRILNEVNLKINAGDYLVISGASGAGKTTLNRIIATLEQPTRGEVFIDGENISKLRAAALPWLRRNFGLIFQDSKLLFNQNVLYNVMLPLSIAGIAPKIAKEKSIELLEKVGLQDYGHYYPIALSGGEQQRLAIARAVITNPPVVIADEPTSHLDEVAAKLVMDLFEDFNKNGVTVIISTHEIKNLELDINFIAEKVRQISLKDGKLTEMPKI